MRAFSVEEGLLMVRTGIPEPLAAGDGDLRRQGVSPAAGHQSTTELLAVGSPSQTTLAGQLEAIRAGRALAAKLAQPMGCQAAALSPGLGPITPQAHPATHGPGVLAPADPAPGRHLPVGFRIHVDIESRIEAATVLERIGVWLPTLLALSANSPFWRGRDTGYASYRYQESLSWPATGRIDVITRLSERRPAVEIGVADVCLDPTDAAAVAALARALVETAARSWRSDPPDVPASVLQAWCWPASRSGVEDRLIDPATGDSAPAGDVVTRLLDTVRPVLSEYGEEEPIESAVADILCRGTGARRQRQAPAPGVRGAPASARCRGRRPGGHPRRAPRPGDGTTPRRGTFRLAQERASDRLRPVRAAGTGLAQLSVRASRWVAWSRRYSRM